MVCLARKFLLPSPDQSSSSKVYKNCVPVSILLCSVRVSLPVSFMSLRFPVPWKSTDAVVKFRTALLAMEKSEVGVSWTTIELVIDPSGVPVKGDPLLSLPAVVLRVKSVAVKFAPVKAAVLSIAVATMLVVPLSCFEMVWPVNMAAVAVKVTILAILMGLSEDAVKKLLV